MERRCVLVADLSTQGDTADAQHALSIAVGADGATVTMHKSVNACALEGVAEFARVLLDVLPDHVGLGMVAAGPEVPLELAHAHNPREACKAEQVMRGLAHAARSKGSLDGTRAAVAAGVAQLQRPPVRDGATRVRGVLVVLLPLPESGGAADAAVDALVAASVQDAVRGEGCTLEHCDVAVVRFTQQDDLVARGRTASACVPSMRMQCHYVHPSRAGAAMSDLVQVLFHLHAVVVRGIPMRRASSSSYRKRHGVVMLCRAHASLAASGGGTTSEDTGDAYAPLGSGKYRDGHATTWRWHSVSKAHPLRVERGAQPCVHLSATTPLDARNPAAVSLMQYVLGGKMVALVREHGEDDGGGGDGRPATKGDKDKVRVDAVLQMHSGVVHVHFLAMGLAPPLREPGAAASAMALRDRPLFSTALMRDLVFSSMLMPAAARAANAAQHVPTPLVRVKGGVALASVERTTRYFPVRSSDSLLWSQGVFSDTLTTVMQPTINWLLFDHIDEPTVQTITGNCALLMNYGRDNDASLLPHFRTPQARRDAYVQLWRELGDFTTMLRDVSPGHMDVHLCMHRLGELHVQLPGEDDKGAGGAGSGAGGSGGGASGGGAGGRSKRKWVTVRRDDAGEPIMPIEVGVLTILSLGRVVWDRPGFHSEKYIWPVGYTASRTYASAVRGGARTHYLCEILDNGDAPLFRITATDDKEHPVTHQSASGAWGVIVRRVATLRHGVGNKVVATVSGPEYFGYTHPTIAHLIEELPNAERCAQYRQHQHPAPPGTECAAQAAAKHVAAVTAAAATGMAGSSASGNGGGGTAAAVMPNASSSVLCHVEGGVGGGGTSGAVGGDNAHGGGALQAAKRRMLESTAKELDQSHAQSVFARVWKRRKQLCEPVVLRGMEEPYRLYSDELYKNDEVAPTKP